MNSTRDAVTQDEYERLLSFRDGLRRFLRWSEEQSAGVGLTAAQHQLLLAVKGHDGEPSVGEVAEHLLLRHHSAVGLVDRAVGAGLVTRIADADDHRVVRLRLSALGERKLQALSEAHLEELSRLRPRFEALWNELPVGG